MVLRGILSIALFAFVFSGVVRADGEPTLPSRNAAVVLPLLRQFTKADPYSKIETILGKPDTEEGSGIYINGFRLDDSTIVTVGTTDRVGVMSIDRSGKGIKGHEVLFEYR